MKKQSTSADDRRRPRKVNRLIVEDRQLLLPFEPLAVKIPVAVQISGIGRTKLYELIGNGRIETVKVGRATLVIVASLRRFIESLRRNPPTSAD